MSREEVAALAILYVTLWIVIVLGIWAAIGTDDKPENGENNE